MKQYFNRHHLAPYAKLCDLCESLLNVFIELWNK
jgi:hypothetical protein